MEPTATPSFSPFAGKRPFDRTGYGTKNGEAGALPKPSRLVSASSADASAFSPFALRGPTLRSLMKGALWAASFFGLVFFLLVMTSGLPNVSAAQEESESDWLQAAPIHQRAADQRNHDLPEKRAAGNPSGPSAELRFLASNRRLEDKTGDHAIIEPPSSRLVGAMR
jgi:hypothetical protein